MTSILFPYIVTPIATYYGSYFVIRFTSSLIVDTVISQTKSIAWYIVTYPFKKKEMENKCECECKCECGNKEISEDYVIIM